MATEKYCQSCAMPMPAEFLLGTEKDGTPNEDYCIYCYKAGKFIADCTMEEMIERCIPHTIVAGIYPDADMARSSMIGFFPTLKRWKK